MKITKILLLLYFLLSLNIVIAAPLNPRIITDFSLGRIAIGNADILFPIYGNNNQLFYLNTQNNIGSDQSWMGSAGIGTRSVVSNFIWGAYCFTDRDDDGYGGRFWVINPGVEIMTNHWDGHANVYFPTSKKKQLSGSDFASNFGITDFIRFTQHSEYDNFLANYRVVGNGIDAELGYSLPMRGNRARIFAGGYFYNPHEASRLTGLEGGLEIPCNKSCLLKLSASHDNVMGNQGRIEIRLALGNIRQQAGAPVQQRILDPIIRHKGTLGTASGILSQQKLLNTGNTGLVNNNIWFFTAGVNNTSSVTLADCTYEHPCVGINSSIIQSIDTIAPRAHLYLAPGNYNNSAPGTGFILNNGQSIFGRTADYRALATNNQRSALNDTLFLNGNNLVTNLQINGNSDVSGSRVGITITSQATGIIQINNTAVSSVTTGSNHHAIGILNLAKNGIVNLQNSVVSALTTGNNSNAFAVFNSGQMHIVSSTLIGNSTSPISALGQGIFNEDFGHITLINSNIYANSPTLAEGIFNEDFGRISIFNSNIIANSENLAEGIFNEDFGKISITNSNINATANNLAIGIFNEDFGVFYITNSRITALSSNSATGIFNEDFGKITLVNSIVIALAPNEVGIQNQDFGQVININSFVFPA